MRLLLNLEDFAEFLFAIFIFFIWILHGGGFLHCSCCLI